MKAESGKLQLSVIVPIYNVEDYLAACLDSIDAAVRDIDAEVLLIDDGSKDGSTALAKAYADEHPRFKYFRKENRGLADARNYGIARASGKYLSFIDSDDLVTEDMFEKMIASAETNDTDVTIINVARFDNKKIYDSTLNVKLFDAVDETVTHINECGRLIYDTIVCNKLIRRDFWIRNGFEFPVGFRFEDMAVALAMHCQARRISIVRTVGYLWRARAGENKSITQENSRTVNLEHRLIMLDRMYDYIAGEMGGDERLKKLLDDKILALDLTLYINAMADMDGKGQEEFASIIKEFFYRHFERSDLERQSALNRQKYTDVLEGRFSELLPLRKYGRSAYLSAPVINTEEGLRLRLGSELFDEEYYDAVNEFAYAVPQHGIDDIVYSGGRLYLKMHSFFERVSVREGEQEIKAVLVNTVSGKERGLKVSMTDGRHVTARYGRVYDLQTGEACDYDYDGTAFFVEIDPLAIGSDKEMQGENIIVISYSCRVRDGSFFVRLPSDDEITGNRILGASVCDGKTNISFAQDVQGALEVRVDAASGEKTDRREAVSGRAACVAGLKAEDDKFKLLLELDEGAACFDEGPVGLCYEDRLAGIKKTLSSAEAGKKLSFDIDLRDPDILQDLYEMQTGIVLTQGDGKVIGISSSPEKRADITADTLQISLLPDDEGRLSLMVKKTDRLTDNAVQYNRRMLYPEFRKEAIDDKLIVFESYWGAQYSCNPRALYEYIDANHPEYTCVWSLVDERTPIKGRGRRVRRGSAEYYRCLATAGYLVNNVNFEKAYVKRKGQTEIQTMHGTPLKTLGLEAKGEFSTEEERVAYVKRNRRWNYLVAQGRFTEEKAASWYGFNKEFLRTGYPRTDGLFDIKEEEKLRIKDELDLPKDRKIILYAPTFRKAGTYDMPLDLDLLRETLSDEYILLIRLHHFVSSVYKVPEDGDFVFDAGGFDSIIDLYKITDILVTDYSSVMFDFALTGNPMVFFAYDLEEYADNTRGVYFDLRTEGPGPVVRTNAELAEVLKAGGHGGEDRARAFREKYLNYECANSSELIYNKVFGNKGRKKISPRQLLIGAAKAVMPRSLYKGLREKRIKKDIR